MALQGFNQQVRALPPPETKSEKEARLAGAAPAGSSNPAIPAPHDDDDDEVDEDDDADDESADPPLPLVSEVRASNGDLGPVVLRETQPFTLHRVACWVRAGCSADTAFIGRCI